MKRIFTILLALLLLGGALAGLASCSAEREPAPDIDEVYDRLVQVIEASHEVNARVSPRGRRR